jgi:hypothetical protein
VAVSKAPSVLYYDQDANLRAVGAEVLSPNIAHQANEESWIRVAWFVLIICTSYLHVLLIRLIQVQASLYT